MSESTGTAPPKTTDVDLIAQARIYVRRLPDSRQGNHFKFHKDQPHCGGHGTTASRILHARCAAARRTGRGSTAGRLLTVGIERSKKIGWVFYLNPSGGSLRGTIHYLQLFSRSPLSYSLLSPPLTPLHLPLHAFSILPPHPIPSSFGPLSLICHTSSFCTFSLFPHQTPHPPYGRAKYEPRS